MRAALLAAMVLLSGCMTWDDDGTDITISPPPSETADGNTSLQTWQSLLILNNSSSEAVCEVRVEIDPAREPRASASPNRRIVLPGETTASGGDLCVFCLEIEGPCEPIGLYTCRTGGSSSVEREWLWWVRCA